MAGLDAWWRKRRQSLTPLRDAISPRGRTLAAAALATLLLAAGIAWWRSSRPAFDFAARDWVLVADCENDIADPVFDSSLFAAFTTELAQSTHVNVMTPARTAATLRWMGKRPGPRIDELTGREICLREKSRALILCKISWDGPAYAFSARLEDPRTGDVARAYVETAATQDGVLDAISRVVYKLRRDLGESRASINRHNLPVAQAVTPSIQTLKLYVNGLELWRAGMADDAIEMYRLALRHDPGFPLLHAALASVYAGKDRPDPERARQHYETALKGAARLTDRERLSMQASYAATFGRQVESMGLYRELLEMYPDAYDARYSLGTLLMRYGRFEEATAQFREVLRLWPGSAPAHVNLATTLTLAGRPGEALGQWEQAFTLEPRWRTAGDNLTHEYGFTLAASGQAPKARELFEAALARRGPLPGMLTSLALLDMYEGRHRAAGERLRQAAALGETARNPSTAAQIHELLAILAEARGDGAAALRELDEAAQALNNAPWQTALNARIGCMYARAGAVARAEQILETMRRHAREAGPREAGYLPLLEGQVALARSDYGRAVSLLEAAALGGSPELGLALLAQAYAASGQVERSMEALERLVAMPSQALGWEAQEPWMKAHAALARAYLERGDRTRAAKVAGSLANRWQNADGDLPLARDIAALSAKLL
jgi:eukaryotic-like serine/threonine-protein kinase